MAACCRCNRTGRCQNCSCVKNGRACRGCLPQRLSNCVNTAQTRPLPQPAPQTDVSQQNSFPRHTPPSPSTADPPQSPLSRSPPLTESHSSPELLLSPTIVPEPRDIAPELPAFCPAAEPIFSWGHLTGPEFAKLLDTTYDEVVHWRRNCFSVPLGRAGRAFVNELSRIYLAYGTASALESVALKAAIVLPILLLQKPSKKSKTKEHIQCLERRLTSWSNGELEELLKEGRAVQHRLPRHQSARADLTLARTFSNLMFTGKCKAALELLSNAQKGGVLHLHDLIDPKDPTSPTVRDVLAEKHPPPQPATNDCILQEETETPHPIIFESLDANVIRSAALKVTGAAGPSGLDAHEWRRLCTNHKGASRDLCSSLASVARRICSSFVDPVSVGPLLASRLIALDKHPGVRPIGIGDTARRIISKAVLTIVGFDVQEAMGCLQLCGGQILGVEAAIHATRSAFEAKECEAALLVDATNAFNALNRQVALQNIRHLCPSISTILVSKPSQSLC